MDELHSAALYETLAKVEKDDTRKKVFASANGARLWHINASVKTRLMRGLIRVFGPSFVLPTLAAAEYADRNKYSRQPDSGQMSADEHHHAGVVCHQGPRNLFGKREVEAAPHVKRR